VGDKRKRIFVAVFLLLAAGSALAGDVPLTEGIETARKATSQELIAKAKELNGAVVSFSGEVIGDIMPRGEFAWLNVEDDFGAIGIWAPLAATKIIQHQGNYDQEGDLVEVIGRFSRTDPELNGDLCIRAQSIKVIKNGQRIRHTLNPMKEKLASILLGLTVVLGGLILIMKKRRKL
jgi:hypothetical protein